MPSSRVHAFLVRRLGQRLERVDVRRSAGPPHRAPCRSRRAPEGRASPARPRRSPRAQSGRPVRRPSRSAGAGRTRRGPRRVVRSGRRPRGRTRDPPSGAGPRPSPHRAPRRSRRRDLERRAAVRPRRGRSVSESRRSRIRRSVAGPMPGTRCNEPSRAIRRKSSGVSAPRAAAMSSIRFGAMPSRRPSPTSSGRALLRSSSSSAIEPVSASSRSRAEIPGPIPRNSRSRPSRTSAMIGALVSRIVAAARRYAREAYGVDSARSRSAANASSSAATVALSRSAGTVGQCDDRVVPAGGGAGRKAQGTFTRERARRAARSRRRSEVRRPC